MDLTSEDGAEPGPLDGGPTEPRAPRQVVDGHRRRPAPASLALDRLGNTIRTGVLGGVALVGAWFDLAAWQSWSESTLFFATVPGAAVVALLAAIGLRTAIVPRELAEVWAITGSLVAFGTMGLGDAAARQPAGLTAAGALLLLALAAGTTAATLGPLMRWLAALLAAAAWVPAAWGLEPSETVATLVGSGVALTWEDALAWAERLTVGGYDDWRLPDTHELQSIVDYTRAPDATDPSRQAPAIDPVFSLSDPDAWFWTSTTHLEGAGTPSQGSFAVYVCFGLATGWMER